MDNDAIADLFSSLGPVSIRRMFGGKGIYHNGVIFAIEIRGELMLKADAETAPALAAAGSKQWIYAHARNGTSVAMPYWTVPDEAIDDPEEMGDWARQAYAAGMRAARSGERPAPPAKAASDRRKTVRP